MEILLAIAVPSILGYVNKANDAKLMANVRNDFLQTDLAITETIIKFDERDNPEKLQKILTAKIAELSKLALSGNSDSFPQFDGYQIKLLSVYFDDLKVPSTLSSNANHFISKIGFCYENTNVSNDYLYASIRVNEGMQVFHSFDKMISAGEDWFIDFAS